MIGLAGLAQFGLDAASLTIGQAGFPEPMMQATLAHYVFLSAVLFSIGTIGFLTRRNLIIMFLCTELMFQAAGLALVAFSRFYLEQTGQTFVIFVLTVAAAEAALALALVVLLFRKKDSLSGDEWQQMWG